MVIGVAEHDGFAQHQDGTAGLFLEEPAGGVVVAQHEVVGGVALGAVDLLLQGAMECGVRQLADRVVAGADGGYDKGHEVKGSRGLGGGVEIGCRHAEHALDAGWISDGNLNVVLRTKSGARVEFRRLDEDAFHRVEGLVPASPQTMNVVQHSSVKVVTPIGPVLWKRYSRTLRNFL